MKHRRLWDSDDDGVNGAGYSRHSSADRDGDDVQVKCCFKRRRNRVSQKPVDTNKSGDRAYTSNQLLKPSKPPCPVVLLDPLPKQLLRELQKAGRIYHPEDGHKNGEVVPVFDIFYPYSQVSRS